jgi:hypothetical protein
VLIITISRLVKIQKVLDKEIHGRCAFDLVFVAAILHMKKKKIKYRGKEKQ